MLNFATSHIEHSGLDRMVIVTVRGAGHTKSEIEDDDNDDDEEYWEYSSSCAPMDLDIVESFLLAK